MLDKSRIDLALYRLEKAESCIDDAKALLKINRYMAAANRAYYAIFHSARAIMALDGEDRKRHSGVISYFHKEYIKSGIFEKSYSHIIQNAFEIRLEADYEDFYVISKEIAIEQVNNSEFFFSGIKDYIHGII